MKKEHKIKDRKGKFGFTKNPKGAFMDKIKRRKK